MCVFEWEGGRKSERESETEKREREREREKEREFERTPSCMNNRKREP
jgi:hypothetical protein